MSPSWAARLGPWSTEPEEIVRQRFIRILVDHSGYTLEQMDQERRTQHGHKSPRADIVIWQSAADKESNRTPVLVTDCKTDTIDIQIQDYYQDESCARASGCEFLIATNVRHTASTERIVLQGMDPFEGRKSDLHTLDRTWECEYMETRHGERHSGISPMNALFSINLISRLVIGSVLGTSAIDKVLQPLGFVNVLSNYPLIPQFLADALLLVIVGIETVLALCIVLGVWFKKSNAVTIGLFAVYTGFLLYSIATGNTNHGCGCFLTTTGGQTPVGLFLNGGDHISFMDVIRDVIFVAIAVVGYVTYDSNFGVDRMWRPATDSTDLANWVNQRSRTQYYLVFIGVLVFGALVSVVTQVSLVYVEKAPLVNKADFHPTGHIPAMNIKAPNFHLLSVEGQNISLSQYRGRVVLLELFALWCPHCQAEAPIIDQLNAALSSSKFQSLSVIASPFSSDYELSNHMDLSQYTRADIRWFKDQFHVKYPILVDPQFHVTNLLLDKWYPTIYLVDKTGVIRNVFTSTTPKNTLLHAIEKLEVQ